MNGRCTVTWTLWLDLLLCSLPQKPIAHLWGPTTLCSHYIHLGSLNATYLQFANITNWLLNLLFKGQDTYAENLALNKENRWVSFKNVRAINKTTTWIWSRNVEMFFRILSFTVLFYAIMHFCKGVFQLFELRAREYFSFKRLQKYDNNK